MVKIIDNILTRLGLKKPPVTLAAPTSMGSANKPKPRRVHENNTTNYHYYTQYDRLYFKTPSGRSPLKITARESVKIVELYKRGVPINDIFNKTEFYHEIGISTLKQWLKQYDKGLMDVALSWICDKHIDGIDVNKKRLIKKGGY